MGRGRSETFLHEEDERGEKQQEQQQTHFITLVNNVIFFRFRFFFSVANLDSGFAFSRQNPKKRKNQRIVTSEVDDDDDDGGNTMNYSIILFIYCSLRCFSLSLSLTHMEDKYFYGYDIGHPTILCTINIHHFSASVPIASYYLSYLYFSPFSSFHRCHECQIIIFFIFNISTICEMYISCQYKILKNMKMRS